MELSPEASVKWESGKKWCLSPEYRALKGLEWLTGSMGLQPLELHSPGFDRHSQCVCPSSYNVDAYVGLATWVSGLASFSNHFLSVTSSALQNKDFKITSTNFCSCIHMCAHTHRHTHAAYKGKKRLNSRRVLTFLHSHFRTVICRIWTLCTGCTLPPNSSTGPTAPNLCPPFPHPHHDAPLQLQVVQSWERCWERRGSLSSGVVLWGPLGIRGCPNTPNGCSDLFVCVCDL